MAVSLAQVRAALMPEEPDYTGAAALGAGALPHLRTLLREGDPMLASKATYLASLIDSADAADVVKEAAERAEPAVKVAAAAAAANLSAYDAAEVLTPLLADPDIGVRKTAVKSVPPDAPPALRSALRQMSDRESHPGIRELSGQMLGMAGSFAGREASTGFGVGEGGGSIDALAVRPAGMSIGEGGDGGGWIFGDRSASADREGAEDGGGDIRQGKHASSAQLTPDGGGDIGGGYVSGDSTDSSATGEGGGSLETAPSPASAPRSGRASGGRRAR